MASFAALGTKLIKKGISSMYVYCTWRTTTVISIKIKRSTLTPTWIKGNPYIAQRKIPINVILVKKNIWIFYDRQLQQNQQDTVVWFDFVRWICWTISCHRKSFDLEQWAEVVRSWGTHTTLTKEVVMDTDLVIPPEPSAPKMKSELHGGFAWGSTFQIDSGFPHYF